MPLDSNVFELVSHYRPAGDQPAAAILRLLEG